MGKPRGEKNQEIGQGHVGENSVCGSLLVSKQDWRDVLEEKDDIDQGPYHHLYKICDLESSLTCGSQGIFVKKHGEDVKSVLEQKEGYGGGGDISCLLRELVLHKDFHILFFLEKKKKKSLTV